jgi:hypothetical protein
MSVAEKLKAIADRIRTYTQQTDKLTLDGMANGINDVHNNGVSVGEQYGKQIGEAIGIEQGKKDAYDEFWDTFQKNGTRKNYISCFGTCWTPDIFKPKYPIKPVNAGYMFFNNQGEKLIIPDFVEFADNLAREQGKTPQTHPDMFEEYGHYKLLDFSDCTYALYGLPTLQSKRFGTLDFSKCTTTSYLFHYHNTTYGVQKIDKFISSEVTKFTDTFSQATKLTDITMSGVVANSINFGACPLNANSVRSVISVLSPDVTGQTVTFKASSKALFSEADWTELITPISNQYNGNWTVAIKA